MEHSTSLRTDRLLVTLFPWAVKEQEGNWSQDPFAAQDLRLPRANLDTTTEFAHKSKHIPNTLSDEVLLILPPSFVCSTSWWDRIDSSLYTALQKRAGRELFWQLDDMSC